MDVPDYDDPPFACPPDRYDEIVANTILIWWRAGKDTLDIARLVNRSEAQVYNLLSMRKGKTS